MSMQDDIRVNTARITDAEIRLDLIEREAANRKPFYLSKGVIFGAISAILPIVIAILKTKDVDPLIIDAVLAAASASGLGAVVGRVTAKGGVK